MGVLPDLGVFPLIERSILVDARALYSSGIGRYLREVLAELFRDPRFGRITLLGNARELARFARDQAAGSRVRIQAYPEGLYTVRSQIAWPVLRTRAVARADVTFFPHYDAPLVALPRGSVVAIHDLIHFRVPNAFSAWRRALAEVLFDRVVSRASRLIAVSESTRRDITQRLPTVASKIEVIPNGVSPYFHPVDEDEIAAQGDSVPHYPFLLCVGNRKPHKNWAAAIETLALLRPEYPKLRLVFVGRRYRGWGADLERAESLDVRDAVVEMDQVDDRLLRVLYSSCEVLLFPSLYEGFGLPVLEAMACGTPVIASNRASLPEVVADAGILVDPHDSGAMADAVRRLHREPGLRRQLRERGIRRAAAFSWCESAKRTVDLLYETAERAAIG